MNSFDGNPVTLKAAMAAHGPGTGTTRRPSDTQAAVSSLPGSEKPCVHHPNVSHDLKSKVEAGQVWYGLREVE